MAIGTMPMPADFKYADLYRAGRPQHEKFDDFWCRHPPMDCGKRAKIFSPFDALRGFSDAVAAKDVQYVNRPELTEEEQLEISRRLSILWELTKNGRLARANRVEVRVTYFSPCADKENFSFGYRGQQKTAAGICRQVDAALSRTLTVGETVIRFQDIIAVEADRIFEEDWEMDIP